MRIPIRIKASIIVAASLSIAVSGCGTRQGGGSSSDTINIGAPLALSGALASTGKDVLAGAELAVKQVNKDGGLLGKKVKLVVRDSQSKPEVAVDASRKMVEDEGAVALLSPASSAEALAVSTSVSEPMKIPMMITSANTDALTVKDFQKYVFAVGPNSLMESKGQAQVLAENEAVKWGIIAADYEGGHSNADAFKHYLKQFKPEAKFVSELYPPLGTQDYTPYVNQMLAAKPDYVFSVLFAGDLVTFTKQAKALGFFGEIPFTSLYDATTLKALGDDAPVGVRGYGRAPFFAMESERGKAFVDAFQKDTDSYPADWSFLGYDAVMAWVEGVKAAGSTDGDEVVTALEKLTFESTRGPMTFRALDHQGDAPEYYYSITAPDPEYGGIPVGKDVGTIPGSEILLTEEEVTSLRK